MKWKTATLFAKIFVGKDILGNEIYEKKEYIKVAVRSTELDKTDVDLLGRVVTFSDRKVIAKISYHLAKDAVELILDGNKYTVTYIVETGRWVIMYIKGSKI